MDQKVLTYREFNKRLDDRPVELRRGQAAFNLMEDLQPEFAESIRGTEIDPYYDDGKLDSFFGAAQAWGAIAW